MIQNKWFLLLKLTPKKCTKYPFSVEIVILSEKGKNLTVCSIIGMLVSVFGHSLSYSYSSQVLNWVLGSIS